MRSTVVIFIIFILSVGFADASNYQIKKLNDSVYAAIAQPNGKVTSNAFFVVTNYEVILAGAHFTQEGISELLVEIGRVTPLPVSQIILTHHHKGFNFLDFDLPEKSEIVVSVHVWQALKGELREFKNPTVVFENALTLNRGKISLIIMDTGPGHSSGDTIVYIPSERILFASDLLFNDTVGYMGEASIHEWGENLDLMERLSPSVVVPGVGKVSDSRSIERFRDFYRAFMTEVIRNVEKGNTLSQTKKEFSLKQYKSMNGFEQFWDVNIERAYKQLKSGH
ncbi:MAG: MBL fold metallo-hydrolase [Geobacteraceae bacterium]|nr:MBL fold metallo-hydrolase [Geobacteraceae bacterium]